MIRVLVVEDEPPILRAVKSIIEQTNPAFTVTATATDGAMAVELLERGHFDVVFTDIRMPVMDGLALLEYLYVNRVGLPAVVLSGYGEFEYARQALKSRAFDYLLKPVSPEMLKALLGRLEEHLGSRMKTQKKRQLSLSINKSSGEAAEGQADDGRQYAVMLVCAGPLLYYDGDFLAPGIAFWEETDINAITAGSLLDGANFWTFRGETGADRIVVAELPPGCQPEVIVNDVYECTGKACNIPVTAVGCSMPVGIQSVNRAYRALRKRLLSAVLIGKSSIHWVNDIDSPFGGAGARAKAGAAFSEAAERLVTALRSGDAKGIAGNLDAALALFDGSAGPQLAVANFFQDVLDGYLQGAANSPDDGGGRRMEIMEAISGSISMEMLKGNMLAAFVALAEDVHSKRDKAAAGRKSPVAEKIEAYLKRNYGKSITNLTLAQEFGFVPSYISRLFRESTGLTISDCLVKIRMDRAKELMAANPCIMVKEVADLVGFKNQYHFSKTFKKQAGVWPTEFKG